MSSVFYITSPKPIPTTELLGKSLGGEVVGDVSESQGSDSNEYYLVMGHFRIEGLSCRPVEVRYEDGNYAVRILALSSVADFELAFHIIEKIAGATEKTITPEGEENALSVGELRKQYGPDWVQSQMRFAFGVVALSAEAGAVNLPGAIRDFYIGPRMIRELTAFEPVDAKIEELHRRMRQCQHIDEEVYLVAETILKEGDDRTCAAWTWGVSYFFPAVDYLVLNNFIAPFLPIDATGLADLAGTNLTWLDEKQALVEAIPLWRWPLLLTRALKYRL